MECDEDYFVEISLDSVLHKATLLENSLRTCKKKAERPPAIEGSTPPLSRQLSAPLPLATGKKATVTSDIDTQWQKLTAYIVSLEKEVQYYKQLAQDIQASHNTVNGKETRNNAAIDCPIGQQLTKSGNVTGQHEEKQDGAYWKVLLSGERENHALYLIFSYLSARELCQVAPVCRKWYSVSRHPQLWRKVVISETLLNPKVLLGIARWCTSTESLVVHGLMPPMASCDEDLQSYIAKTRGSLEPGLKAMLEASSTSLSSLVVTECSLMATERVLWLASIHSPNLNSLTYCSDEFPPSSESLWSLANGCPHIQHLTLPPVLDSPHAAWFNDSCLSMIAQAWPHLLSLTIGGSAITPDGLKEIAQKCQKLCHLEVMHGPSLHKEAMEKLCIERGFQSLTRLILNFTPASHLALKLLFENCPCLRSVELHITLRLYFSDTNPETITNYGKILTKIKKLKKHPKGKDIFHLYEH